MSGSLIIHMFPCLYDNYGFLIHSPDTGETATIDTPDGGEIEKQCREKGWTLTHIWNTHHHPDHVGGNAHLIDVYNPVVIGHEKDKARIPGLTKGVLDQDLFEFAGHTVHVIDTPGHTIGHIIYHIPEANAAFVGDTLFVMGCGRLFEGTPAQMFESLQAISALPDNTRLYCAHEYTLSNGRFALTVEPDNADLTAYMKKAEALRDEGIPTVPTTVAQEKKINPFVRAGTAARLGEIRSAKDNF